MPAQRSSATSLLGAGLGLLGFSAIAGLLVTVMVAPAIAVTGMTASNSLNVFQDLPDYITIESQPQRNVFVAREADGTEVHVADLFNQNREDVALDQISEHVVWAAIDGEDRRFREHGGVDIPSVARAAIGYVTDDDAGGASTLTMQLVRNILVLRAENTPLTAEYTKEQRDADIQAAVYPDLNRKLKEMKFAISLEKQYTKDEILQAYLNIVLMGGTTYGIEAGAQRYFGVSARDLSPAQAASLIAIVQNPSTRNLARAENFERNESRRNFILGWMFKQGHLDQAQYDEAIATPVDETTVTNNAPRNGCTSAPVELRYACDYALKSIYNGEVPSLGASKTEQLENWKKGGYKVVLSVVPSLQGVASATAAQYADPYEARMQLGASVTSTEVGTGRILVMAQNKTFDDTGNGDASTTAVNFSADATHGANKGAQPGSTYKPFTLLAFLAAGHGARETFDAGILKMSMSSFRDTCNAGGTWGGPDYTFRNDSNERGLYNAVSGTAASVNSVFLQMAAELDQCEIRDMAASLGMHRADGAADGSDMHTNPGCALGGCENNFASLTIAAAYGGIANQGTYCKPIIIDDILTQSGESIGGQPISCNPSLATPAVANTTAYAMAQVMTSGTGSASNPRDGTPYIGKTGTANKAQNTWMAGSSTRVSTAVWVGNIEGNQSLRAISVNGVYGGTIRHRIFKPIAQAIDAIYPGAAFPGPDQSLMTGTPVIVPDNLVGGTPEQAMAALQLAKLSYEDGGQMDSDLPAGTVVATDPASGASVPKGTAVRVFTSNGLAGSVPDVSSGQNNGFTQARTALQAAGFMNVTETCVVASGSDPPSSLDKVVSQNPSAGSVVNKASTVTLSVRKASCGGGGGGNGGGGNNGGGGGGNP